MISCKDVIMLMNKLAPEHLSESWDNTGLIIGRRDRQAERILISLDYTFKTLGEAIDKNCQMVITHHPPIFSKISKINDDTPIGRLILESAKNDICVYSAHTNLDFAAGGTNDILFDILGLSEKEPFMPANEYGESLGRVGVFTQEHSLGQVCEFVKEKLGISTLKCVGDPKSKALKAAIMTGSGASGPFFAQAMAKEADVYITGDLKYHDALGAAAMGLNIIDATHFATENIVCESIKNYLEKNWSNGCNAEVILSETSAPPFKFV